MLILRPLVVEDLDNLYNLANLTKHGITTLPKDKNILRDRLSFTQQTFAIESNMPKGELYFFGLEDVNSKKLVGCSAIISKVGGFKPFYTYKIKVKTHHSKKLNITGQHKILTLVEEHDGPTEIGSLFLHPDYRKGQYGKLLSLFRFLYIAEHRSWFEDKVIAEMRGYLDEYGNSPFWDAIGRHFFNMDYIIADYLSVVDKGFIAELMPKYPIYVDILTREAKNVINKVHPNTKPALAILKKEGFNLTGMVDIFEGGPLISCQVDNISSVKNSFRDKVCDIGELSHHSKGIIMTTNRSCRALIGLFNKVSTGVQVDNKSAEVLGLKVGDSCRCLAL